MNRSSFLFGCLFGFAMRHCMQWIEITSVPWLQRSQELQQQQQHENEYSTPRRNTRSIQRRAQLSIFEKNPVENVKTVSITKVHNSLSAAHDKIQETSTSDSSLASSSENHICRRVTSELIHRLGDGDTGSYSSMPHTSSIWNYFSPSIFEASRFANDTNDVYHDFTLELMRYITPSRLATSRKGLPFSNWEQVESIIHITYERWLYVHNLINHKEKTTKNVPKKLKIVVFGGSVPSGAHCMYSPIRTSAEHLKEFPNMSDEDCSWPSRLEYFLNSLLVGSNYRRNTDGQTDMDIVSVSRVTLGGTSSEYGMTLLDLSLLPDDVPRDPDIVINAYSTNDANQFRIVPAGTNITKEQNMFDKLQQFIRLYLTMSEKYSDPTCTNLESKRNPLLLFYNDFHHRDYNNVMDTLTTYYGLGYMSFYETVQDLVYPDSSETWFSPPPGAGQHSGMGMHITSMWIIAYNLLEYATTYCSSRMDTEIIGKSSIIPTLRNDYAFPYSDVPKKKLSVLPPPYPLDGDFRPSDVSILWNKAEQQQSGKDSTSACQKQQQASSDEAAKSPCLFACLVSYGGLNGPPALNSYMNQHIIFNDGWTSELEHDKLGYVPTGANSKFVMNFPNISQPVTTINLLYMKSYGSRWEGSQVIMTTTIQRHGTTGSATSTVNEFTGCHDQQTSVTYTSKVPIDANIGDDVTIEFKLVAGETFKITGMALCDAS